MIGLILKNYYFLSKTTNDQTCKKD